MTAVAWCRFFPATFTLETLGMSPTAVGGYMRLVCHQIQHGDLPADDKALDRICGGIRRALPEVRAKLVERDGRLSIPWVEEERQRASSAKVTAIERARAGARGLWSSKHPKEDAPSMLQACSKQSSKHPSSNAPSMLEAMQIKNSIKSSNHQPPPFSPNGADNGGATHEPAAAAGSNVPSSSADDAARRLVALYPPSRNPIPHLDLRAAAAAVLHESNSPDGVSVDEMLEATRRYAATKPTNPMWPRSWFDQRGYRPYVDEARQRVSAATLNGAAKASPAALDPSVIQAERAWVESVLDGLNDDELARLKTRAVEAAAPMERRYLEQGDPRKALLLRASMAEQLSDGEGRKVLRA